VKNIHINNSSVKRTTNRQKQRVGSGTLETDRNRASIFVTRKQPV